MLLLKKKLGDCLADSHYQPCLKCMCGEPQFVALKSYAAFCAGKYFYCNCCGAVLPILNAEPNIHAKFGFWCLEAKHSIGILSITLYKHYTYS
jgi:hypothetical protein